MRRLLAAAAIMLVLAACEADVEVLVRNDGSGTVGFSLTVEKQYLAMLQGFGGDKTPGGDPFASMRRQLETSSVHFDVSEFDAPKGGKGIRATTPFRSIEDLRTLMSKLQQKQSASSALTGGLGKVTIEQRSGGWYFEASSGATAASPTPSSSSLFDPKQLAGLLTISFAITLPGEKTSTTADSTSAHGGSTTFVWHPDLAGQKALHMVAETSGSARGFPVIPVAAGLAAGVALGGGLFGLARSRSRKPPPPPGVAQL